MHFEGDMMRNKKELSTSQKRTNSETISVTIFSMLVALALILVIISTEWKGWMQNLLLGLGTGAATSALVSLAFYLNDKQIKRRDSFRSREKFMCSFKIFYYNLVCAVDFAEKEDGDRTVMLEEYIKMQHR